MGGEVFITHAKGKTAEKAFAAAVKQAQYDHGHSGYTGTIAEKGEFVMIELKKGEDAEKEAYRLIDQGDERIDDKWGAAGCFDLGKGEYLFFGWASS